MTVEMPIPHTPLYIGLATFVAKLLRTIAEAKPVDIDDRATGLEGKAGELSTLIEQIRTLLRSRLGQDQWSGQTADSGRGLLESLLRLLNQRADKARDEAAALRSIATLLKSTQDYYTRQATTAENLLRKLISKPHLRQLAQLMAILLGHRLAQTIGQFRTAINTIGTGQLTPLWNDTSS